MDKMGNRNIDLYSQKEYEDTDYIMHWQYLNSYINSVISNLELFKKVMYDMATLEELFEWYKTFYGELKNSDKENLDLIFSITPEEKERDYHLYREFVLNILNKYVPLISMHLNYADEAVRSLNATRKRMNNIINSENGE